MALSESKISRVEESRGSLYYNQWQLAVTWRQPEVSVLRETLDPYKVMKALAHRRHWESTRGWGWQRPAGLSDPVMSIKIENKIEMVRSWLAADTTPRKLVFSTEQITVYTNDKDVAEQLVELACSVSTRQIKVKQAVLDQPADTVIFKNPYNYSYRTYFRGREISEHARQTLLDWVVGMDDNVYACPSLLKFLKGHARSSWRTMRNYTWDHYFLDHNDHKLDVWIAMVCPGIVRKTMAIQSPAK